MSLRGFLRSATKTSARIFVLALLWAVAARHVFAFGGECPGLGAAIFSPAHPSTSDVISVQVLSSLQVGLGPYVPPPGIYTLSSVEVAPINTILINVINTPNPGNFPGFNLVASPADDWYGIIGPLPAGDYVVPTSVLKDYGGSLYPLDPLCVNPVINQLTVASQSAATVIAPVVEFYYAALDHYFVTQNPQEIAALDGGVFKGWVRTGQSFLAYAPGQSDNRGRRVCRFYGSPSAGLDSHFFSASIVECIGVQNGPLGTKWLLEGDDVFEIALPNSVTGTCPASTAPVYRLWNNRSDSNHRYTTDLATKQLMISKGYVAEGYGPDAIVMCAPMQ
jgi:hypothetical protein